MTYLDYEKKSIIWQTIKAFLCSLKTYVVHGSVRVTLVGSHLQSGLCTDTSSSAHTEQTARGL